MLQDAQPPGAAGPARNAPPASLDSVPSASGTGEERRKTLSRFPFVLEDAGEGNFNHNKEILNKLGYRYSFEIDAVLLACEKAVPGGPRDGDHELTLTRNGSTAHIFWRIKGSNTVLLSMAADAEELKKKADKIKKTTTGWQANALAKAGLIPHLNRRLVTKITEREQDAKILKALGYEPKARKDAIRALSARCDNALSTTRADTRISPTRLPGVLHFEFTEFGPKKETVQVLRWVEVNEVENNRQDVRQLMLFEKDGLEDALNRMSESIDLSRMRRRTNQARAALPPPAPSIDNGLDRTSVTNIVTRHRAFLTAMGWEEIPIAVRELGDLCETTARNAQDGNSVSDTRLPDVEHFRFPQGAPGQQALEVLRWKHGDRVREILPFEVGGIEAALEQMERTKERSLRTEKSKLKKSVAEGGAST